LVKRRGWEKDLETVNNKTINNDDLVKKTIGNRERSGVFT
jgi:hypothetical protein